MILTRSFAMTMILAGFASAQALPQEGPMGVPPMPVTPAPTTTPADPAEMAAAKKVLTDYNAAVDAGDVLKLLASFDANEVQQKSLGMMGRIAESRVAVYKAILEKFGQPALTEAGFTKDALGGVFPVLPVDMLQIRLSGEKAVLVGPDGAPMPLSLVKRNGTWKIDAGIIPPQTDEQLKEQTAIIEAALKAMTETTDDIKAGHFRSPDEVPILLQHREQKAIEKTRLAQMQQVPQPQGVPADLVEPTTAPSVAPAK